MRLNRYLPRLAVPNNLFYVTPEPDSINLARLLQPTPNFFYFSISFIYLEHKGINFDSNPEIIARFFLKVFFLLFYLFS